MSDDVKNKLDFAKSYVNRAETLIGEAMDLLDSSQQEQEEQDRPNRAEEKYYVPDIEVVKSSMKTHGKYRTSSGQARGVVVHFTAGRIDRNEGNAIGTIKYLGSKRLGCLAMDLDGTIYRSSDQAMDEVAYHAGRSEWKGASGVSRYCYGMEIINPGKLDGSGKSWFGKKYTGTRKVHSSNGYVVSGEYLPYTAEQEEALINFCLWQKATNPEFDLDWVVGHDECAIPKGRKNDPGGCLSMPMPEFRNLLKRKAQEAGL